MDINVYLLIFLIIIYILGAYQMLMVLDGMHEDGDISEPYDLADFIVILFWWVVIILQIIKRHETRKS